jgi:hypothetical protein
MLTPEQLAECRERERKATAGPWVHRIGKHQQNQQVQSSEVGLVGDGDESRPLFTGWAWKPGGHRDARPNADFIAHARTDIPALLAHIEEQAADTARLRWFFGDSGKTAWLPEYMRGMREHWTFEQWMASLDAARGGQDGQ